MDNIGAMLTEVKEQYRDTTLEITAKQCELDGINQQIQDELRIGNFRKTRVLLAMAELHMKHLDNLNGRLQIIATLGGKVQPSEGNSETDWPSWLYRSPSLAVLEITTPRNQLGFYLSAGFGVLVSWAHYYQARQLIKYSKATDPVQKLQHRIAAGVSELDAKEIRPVYKRLRRGALKGAVFPVVYVLGFQLHSFLTRNKRDS